MTQEQLHDLMMGDYSAMYDVAQKKEKIIKLGDKKLTVLEAAKQYDPYLHDVNDPAIRKNRTLEHDTDEYVDVVSGETKASPDYEQLPVNRLQLARQKQIVDSAIFFECGSDIVLEYSSEDESKNEFFKLIKKVWEDNKLSFKTEDIVERRMVETHCAELWYDYEDPEYWNGTPLEGSVRRPGMTLLCKKNGDDIYPMWDNHGGLIGLGRRYEVIDPVTETRTLRFDMYTSDLVVLGRQVDGGRWETEMAPDYGFLAIVYYAQDRPEYADTQPLADREETIISNTSDTNDYYGDPTMVVDGEAESLPSQGEVAKVIQVKGENGNKGSVTFAQPDAMVESKKLEMEIVKQEQFDLNYAADLSFSTMSKLMSNGTSGIALRLLFMGPQMKGNKAQKRLKEMLTRRNNVIKRMLMQFSPAEFADMMDVIPAIKIKDALPINKQEVIRDTVSQVNAKLLSRKSAMMILGEVSDVEAELEQILSEVKQDRELAAVNVEK